MRGKRLKQFADTLPQEEKAALYALCEPEWKYEVVSLTHGEQGNLINVCFIWCNCRTAPLYKDGLLRWLYELRAEDKAILDEYDALKPQYLAEMVPYPWQKDIVYGKEDPGRWCMHWLDEHDPSETLYSDELWLERDTVLEYLIDWVGSDHCLHIMYDRFVHQQLSITKESVVPVQKELTELEEWEQSLRKAKENGEI